MTVVESRRRRSTGTVVDVIDNRDGGFDTDDLAWITLCVEHGNYCSHPTRELARWHAPHPATWCAECAHAIGQQVIPNTNEERAA